MNSDLDSEELTALFLTLTGIEIQKATPGPVSSRKLYKVLANAIWDWSLLPQATRQPLGLSSSGDLIWVPHRFGSLGLVKPSLNYDDVRLAFGLFASFKDLLGLGIYAKYGVEIIEGGNGRMLFEFPRFLSISQLLQSRIDEIDRHLWPQVAKIYAGLNDRSLDTLASCRNATATIFSLWIQMVVWKSDLLRACEILQEAPEQRRSDREKQALKAAISGAAAAASQFVRKLQYWNDKDSVISSVRAAAVDTEFASLIPVIDFHRSCFDDGQLTRLLSVRDLLEAANVICQGLFRQCKLCDGGEILAGTGETMLKVIHGRLPEGRWPFRELASLWFGSETKPVADYIETLVREVCSHIEHETGLQLNPVREHYRSFVETGYPLPRNS